jgi:hypothetical protein
MAGHARYTALLDACVLYPVAMTDALLSLATAGFFAAKWTTLIETEWTRSLERQRPDLGPSTPPLFQLSLKDTMMSQKPVARHKICRNN